MIDWTKTFPSEESPERYIAEPIKLNSEVEKELERFLDLQFQYTYNWLSANIWKDVEVYRKLYNLEKDPEWDYKFEWRYSSGLARSYVDVLVHNLKSAIFAQAPFFFVRPLRGGIKEAEEASDRVERFLDILLRRKDIETIIFEALRLAAIDGTAFLHIYFDAAAQEGKGDIEFDLDDVYKTWIIRPDASSWSKVWGIASKEFIRWEELRRRFQDKFYYQKHMEKALNDIFTIQYLDMSFQNEPQTRIYPLWVIDGWWDINRDGEEEHIIIHYIWGGGSETGGNYLLGVYEYPYKDLDRNVVVIKIEEDTPHKLYGKSIVGIIKPSATMVDFFVNCGVNRTAFDIIPPMTATPQIAEMIEEEGIYPGQIIPLSPSAVIQPLQLPTPMNIIAPMLQLGEKWVQQLSNISLVQMGILPPAKTSATATNIASQRGSMMTYARLRAIYKQLEEIPEIVVGILKTYFDILVQQFAVKEGEPEDALRERAFIAVGGRMVEQEVLLYRKDLEWKYQYFTQGAVIPVNLIQQQENLLTLIQMVHQLAQLNPAVLQVLQDPQKIYAQLRHIAKALLIDNYEELFGTEEEWKQAVEKMKQQQEMMAQLQVQAQQQQPVGGATPEEATAPPTPPPEEIVAGSIGEEIAGGGTEMTETEEIPTLEEGELI